MLRDDCVGMLALLMRELLLVAASTFVMGLEVVRPCQWRELIRPFRGLNRRFQPESPPNAQRLSGLMMVITIIKAVKA
jgi:hypothetical protein